MQDGPTSARPGGLIIRDADRNNRIIIHPERPREVVPSIVLMPVQSQRLDRENTIVMHPAREKVIPPWLEAVKAAVEELSIQYLEGLFSPTFNSIERAGIRTLGEITRHRP